MSWIGPNYGAWADTVEAMNDQARQLERTHASIEQWKKHCQNLEQALEDVTKKYGLMTEKYINRVGAEAGQALLKEAALKEIQALDPTNKLLDPEYRKAIYHSEKEKTENELRKK